MLKFNQKILKKHENISKMDPKKEPKSRKIRKKQFKNLAEKLMRKRVPKAQRGTCKVPGGEYNSTRYPPDRIYPRRKTNRRTPNKGGKIANEKCRKEKS